MRLLLLISLCAVSMWTQASTPATNDYHYYHPVTLTAKRLNEAWGKPLGDLSLMAINEGELQPIPFQFEEYDELGLIYIDGESGADRVGQAGVFDGQDLLVFMYRDTGEQRLTPETRPLQRGQVLRELRFASHDGRQRYAYLVENNPQRSTRHYVEYSTDDSAITGTNYYYRFDDNNLAKPLEYRLGGQPEEAPNLFADSLFELKSSVLFKLLRFTFSNKRNVTLKVVAHHQGPVRNAMIVKARSTFFAIPVFSMYLQFNAYGHAMNVPGIEINKLRMNKFIRSLRRAARYLLEPQATFYVDYQGFDGAQIQLERTSRLHSGIGTVDGEENAYENAMRHTFLPGQWLWFKHRDWSILTSSAIPEELLDLQGLHPRMIYHDKRDETGQLSPRVGFTLRGEPIALDEIAKGLKLADRFFDNMRPESLDGIFLAVIEGTAQGKSFEQILQEQNLAIEDIQQLFDIFQLDLDIYKIGKLVDTGHNKELATPITLSELLAHAGVKESKARDFMGMFQLEFDATQQINNLPAYSQQLMRHFYRGYRDKIKNGITVWTPKQDAEVEPHRFNYALNHPPRLLDE